MSKHKHTNKICITIIALMLVITILFMNGETLGIAAIARTMGYENRLFDTSRVHTIDIVMDDWETFLTTCTSEEYSPCSIVIDGDLYKNVGIRGKGNTSLSSVAAYGNNRYSFKLEFDQYVKGNTYYGLDKLCLNNIIQDNTYMKDYLTYVMMNAMGIAAPLCSFVYITVNGEDWGLYLAVESVEDGFLERNYGTDYGELYKPDNLSMGGGRGNGMNFDMNDFMSEMTLESVLQMTNYSTVQELLEGLNLADIFTADEIADMEANKSEMSVQDFLDMAGLSSITDLMANVDMGSMPNFIMPSSDWIESGEMPEMRGDMQMPEGDQRAGGGNNNMRGNFGGMGSSDVMLQYIDDDPDSYSNIFGNAKTDITEADQTRLIESLKKLSEGTEIESIVDVEEVIKYLVVHNFVCNGDSYTGSMIHNYYLYEEDGVLSMIPWDYNLAFGAFNMGSGFSGTTSGATSEVNSPIDTPVSGGTIESRPMIAWIFASDEYTELYHRYYAEFIETYFNSGYFTEMYDEVIVMISPYVEKDPTKFCTYEEFETGTATLREFCLLRAESVSGQLKGTIPSTQEGQSADSSALIDASHISTSDMGNMSSAMGGGMMNREGETREWGGNRENMMPQTEIGNEIPQQIDEPVGEEPQGDTSSEITNDIVEEEVFSEMPEMPAIEGMPDIGIMPDYMPNFPNGGEMPEGMPGNFQGFGEHQMPQ